MHGEAPSAETRTRLKALLRRELKFGDDAIIEDDTPLLDGELDIDSLDVLLVVTCVEREFKIKIPNEAVGQQAFTNVTTLARFIEEHAR